MLKKWAKAGTQNDTLLIMQINHAGKQSPAVVNKTPLAPSAVPLVGMDGFINPPRELSADEINGLIQQFVQTAKIAEQAGFSGVQIHAAHGYLISQFLSSHHNRRQDLGAHAGLTQPIYLIKVVRLNRFSPFIIFGTRHKNKHSYNQQKKFQQDLVAAVQAQDEKK